jgi:hypothetical protein
MVAYEAPAAVTTSNVEISCDFPGCDNSYWITLGQMQPSEPWAITVQGILKARGWTQDAPGVDFCPKHSPPNSA